MAKKQIRVVAAVVQREGLYLITQRRAEAVLGGLWEFPGGKVEPGEGDAQALRREFAERLGAPLAVGDKLAERYSEYDDYAVTLALYAGKLEPDAQLEPRRVSEYRWVPSSELERYPFPAADQNTMDALLGVTRSN